MFSFLFSPCFDDTFYFFLERYNSSVRRQFKFYIGSFFWRISLLLWRGRFFFRGWSLLFSCGLHFDIFSRVNIRLRIILLRVKVRLHFFFGSRIWFFDFVRHSMPSRCLLRFFFAFKEQTLWLISWTGFSEVPRATRGVTWSSSLRL